MNDDELGGAEDEEDESVEDLNEAVLSVTQETEDPRVGLIFYIFL